MAVLLAFIAEILVTQVARDGRTANEIALQLQERIGARSYHAGGNSMTDFVADIPTSKLPLVAKQLWEEINHGAKRSIANELLMRWAAVERSAALEFAESLTHRNVRMNASESAVDTWSRSNLEGASAYVFSHGGEQLKRWASRGIIAEMAHRDPAQALAFAQDNRLLQRRYSSTLIIIPNQLTSVDVLAAIRKAKKLTLMHSRNQALGGILSLISRWHPDSIKEKSGPYCLRRAMNP